MKTQNKIMAAFIFLVFSGALFAQAIPIELWFDKGQDSLTDNHGYAGFPKGILQTGVVTGDGASSGPIWSDDVPFSYTGNHSLHFMGNANNVWLGYGDSVGINAVDNFTIETWMKPEESVANRQDILVVRDSVRQVLMFRMQRVGGNWELESYIWDYADGSWKVARTTGGALTLDEWQHVAMTYDNSSGGHMFINGQDTLSFPIIGDMPDFGGNWWISSPGSFAFQGYLDEFRVSDYPRIPGDGSGYGFAMSWDDSFTQYATAAPALMSPIGNVAVNPAEIELQWSAIDEAEYYRVLVAKNPDFRNAFIDSSELYDNNLRLEFADTVATYYWCVGAANEFETINWSATDSFCVSHETALHNSNAHAVAFHLHQNYPNPFNAATMIAYDLPSTEHVRLRVFDLMGQELRCLVNEEQKSGQHRISFTALGMPTGIYLYRLEAGGFSEVKKFLYVK